MKDNGRDNMTIWEIVALIIAILLIAAVIISLLGKAQADHAAAYEKRLAADREYHTALIRAAHVETVGGRTYLFSGVDKKTHEVMWQDFPTEGISAPQIVASAVKNDPRHELLSELIALTLNAAGYGLRATKIISCDRAQAVGGTFADRDKWQEAVSYGVEIGLLMTTNQGTLIKSPYAAGDLSHQLLLKSKVLESAVNAIPEQRPALGGV